MSKSIIELKAENQALRDELAAVKAGMNKIKADAIREAVQQCVFSHDQGVGLFGEGFDFAAYQYDKHLEQYANQVEKGE
jgi:regulator of replication initiation timing